MGTAHPQKYNTANKLYNQIISNKYCIRTNIGHELNW